MFLNPVARELLSELGMAATKPAGHVYVKTKPLSREQLVDWENKYLWQDPAVKPRTIDCKIIADDKNMVLIASGAPASVDRLKNSPEVETSRPARRSDFLKAAAYTTGFMIAHKVPLVHRGAQPSHLSHS